MKVDHPAQAYGYVVGYGNKGDKVVYSGDTLPCETLIREGLFHLYCFQNSELMELVLKYSSYVHFTCRLITKGAFTSEFSLIELTSVLTEMPCSIYMKQLIGFHCSLNFTVVVKTEVKYWPQWNFPYNTICVK